jgi:hypothetical protein
MTAIDPIAAKDGLERIFDVSFRCAGLETYRADGVPESVTARMLFDACVVLNCRPDELYTVFDATASTGCPTCGPDLDREFTIEVRR